MERDGNGWVRCALGHAHWGRHGAAGLMLHTVDHGGAVRLLLQHRAAWSHHGDTWGLPGGARDSHEDVVDAARREAAEEARLDPSQVRVRHTYVDDHGGWSYTTVAADTPTPLEVTPDRESTSLEWVPVADVAGRALHPGFAATWPALRPRATVVLVDAANVVGSRPDGWWRDRPGAASRLLRDLVALRAVTVGGPAGRAEVIGGVVAVVEGAAAAAHDPEWVQVVRARRAAGESGDDAVVAAARRQLAHGTAVTAVTADRGLRARLAAAAEAGRGDLRTEGPRWLLGLLDQEAAGKRG